MKDLADEYAAAICTAAEELAADHAEMSMRNQATLDAAAEAAKRAIESTSSESRVALDRFCKATEAAHIHLTARMAERAREFLGVRHEPLPPAQALQMTNQPDELNEMARKLEEQVQTELTK
jgi:hypothetical protein